MKARLYPLIVAAVLIGSCPVFSQFGLFMPRVSSQIKLAKDTFLLEEPFFVNLVVQNDGKKTVFIDRGGEKYGDNRSGLRIAVISQTGDTLKTIFPDMIACSYFYGYHELFPNHKMYFEFFLPKWVSIEQEGIYRLVISKDMHVHPINPFLKRDYSNGIEMTTIAETVFVVKKDDQAMGQLIQELVDLIKISRDKDYYYDLTSTLLEINDERVIPFLEESLRKNQYLERCFSIQHLSKFKDIGVACQALIFAADSEMNSCCQVFTDSISICYSSWDIRQSALRGLLQSQQASAFEYLLSTKREDPAERLYLVQNASYCLPKAKARKLLELFIEDEHPFVRRKAMAEIQKIKDD
jgi:hypothetical protein